VRAWPTIVVIDPRGYVLGQHAGEFTAAMVAPTLKQIIAAAGDALQRGALFPSTSEPRERDALRYPGKIAVQGERIAIADSGNDRVLVGRLTAPAAMRVDRVVGSTRGHRDGPDAQLDNPQGVLFDGETLLVADAGNHVVREIDLRAGGTRTIAGTGSQLRTRADLAAGALSSPWDLATVGNRVAVAMAGNHRLYMLGRDGGKATPFAGTGAEELHDGPLREAALAQPMGIWADGERIYFADAETSAIRVADANDAGSVRTLVGTGLFDFGDVDGSGDTVRLQHAQAVIGGRDGRLLIADSYNDALKWLDPETRRVTTWIRGLHEPTGLAFGEGVVYVADTDAHRIAVVDLETKLLTPLELKW
jgi:DNA-binding beta-propeller fold protein YncE